MVEVVVAEKRVVQVPDGHRIPDELPHKPPCGVGRPGVDDRIVAGG